MQTSVLRGKGAHGGVSASGRYPDELGLGASSSCLAGTHTWTGGKVDNVYFDLVFHAVRL